MAELSARDPEELPAGTFPPPSFSHWSPPPLLPTLQRWEKPPGEAWRRKEGEESHGASSEGRLTSESWECGVAGASLAKDLR